MKVIISYLETKRYIDGPFQICGKREDLLRVANLIIQACHKHSEITNDGAVRETFTKYGWIDITDPPVKQAILMDAKLLGWDE